MPDPGAVYQLVVDSIHIDNQRDKDHDDDSMAISAVIVGGESIGTTTFGVGSEIHTGALLDGRNPEHPGDPPLLDSRWGSPRIALPMDHPEKVWIAVNVLINNDFDAQGHTVPDVLRKVADIVAGAGVGGLAVGQDSKLTQAWWTGQVDQDLVGLATKLSNFIEGAVVGLAVAALMDFILGLFGTHRTCVGPVFDKAIIVPAASLDDLVAAGQTTTDTGTSIVSQDGCGANPHTHITYHWERLTVPSFGGPTPKAATTTSPIAASGARSWAGSYGNIDSVDAADVSVVLTAASPDPVLKLPASTKTAAPASKAGDTQVFGIPHVTVNLVDRFDKGHPITVSETQIANTQIASPFTKNLIPLLIPPGGFKLHGFETSGSVAKVAPGSVTEVAQASATKVAPGQVTKIAPAAPGLTKASAAAAAVAGPTILRHAQTLALSDGSTLQLYGGYAASGRWLETRIRYQRPANDKRTATDVMLIPAQHSLH
jgi:hypothetical protein